MKAISKSEGHKLIQEGKAGWYAASANPPIPHPTQMVICAGGNFYLASTEEIKLEELGPTYITGLDGSKIPKMLYNVTLEDGSELCNLLKKDFEAGKDIDVGAGILTKYTGHPGRPEQLN